MKHNIKKLALTIATVIALVGITYAIGATVNKAVPTAHAGCADSGC